MQKASGRSRSAWTVRFANIDRYPRGGFHKILDALVKVGERFGVEYRFNTSVTEVIVDDRNQRATGVRLENGETLKADIVLMNADLVYAYKNLLPSSSKATALDKKPSSCASISFYWAMDTIIPQLNAHNVFLADDYQDSFDDIFKRQLIPKEPSFYVHVPTRVDDSAAPAGKDTVVVLVPCGHLLEGEAKAGLNPSSQQDWDAMVSKARNAVCDTIKARTGADLKAHIASELLNTPATWKEKFNLDKGAILGLSHSFFNVLAFRPNTKHDKISALYFVGASTHPGTGVPIVLAGSKITSDQILDDYGMMKPWAPGTHKRRVVSSLDKEGSIPYDLTRTVLFGLATLVMVLCLLFFSKQSR